MAQKKKQPLTHFKDFNTPKRSVYWHWSSQTRILPSCMKCCLIEQNIAHIWATSHTNEQNFAQIVTFCVIEPYFSLVVHLFVCIQGYLHSCVCVYIQGVPKNILIEQNHNRNWVLWGKFYHEHDSGGLDQSVCLGEKRRKNWFPATAIEPVCAAALIAF